MRTVRIGNGCGFWGDNLDAPRLLAEAGALHYLTLEYLAELTMSILALQKQRDPEAGYASDFLDVLPTLLPALQSQPRLKIVTNAGGMNPRACAHKARRIASAARIAIVQGDDLLPRLDELLATGVPLQNLDTGEQFGTVRDRVVSANAYLGSLPIAAALNGGARIVVTGRVADAALVVGPLLHEFDWKSDDWDRLCAGTAAGHLLECGAQATGGLWCNWQEARDLANVGYPLAEVQSDGAFTLSKPAGTGGVVNRETVAEQLLYEVGDPVAYLTPDVTADFTTLTLAEVGTDAVRITGARGKPSTDSYKVSIAYRDGWSASGTLVVAGPAAVAKAAQCGQMVLDRLERAGAAPTHHHVELLGAGATLAQVDPNFDPPEVVLRIAVRDARRHIVERFSKELAPLVTSGPPGITGYTTGRPVVREVFAYWPTLVPKAAVQPTVEFVE